AEDFLAFEVGLEPGPETRLIEAAARWQVPGTDPPFTLTSRADRIDLYTEGKAMIIDYKSGTAPSGKVVAAGYAPQLPLTAALLEAGAFDIDHPPQAEDIEYGHMKIGGKANELRLTKVAGKGSKHNKTYAQITALTKKNLVARLNTYANPQTPYLARTAAQFDAKALDYDGLSRFREWAVIDDAEAEGDD
ncbi:MAG: PD-(D/E)XK nuclease family protein, partial [Pseudomonadota bacterium]